MKPTLSLAVLLIALSANPIAAQEAEVPELPTGSQAPVPAERPGEPEKDEERSGDDRDAANAGDADQSSRGDEDVPSDPEPLSKPQSEDAAALRACRAALVGLGATFERLDPIVPDSTDQAGCGIAAPLSVSAILPDVTLRPESRMRCATALALARWIRNEAMPAARALELGPITAIEHGSSYVCRARNNQEDAEISEHAKGNAIDIMRFVFSDGSTVAVEPRAGDGDAAEAFQKAVGSGACLYFRTVLGPGADAYHDDHFHLDVIERDSGYRLCQTP